MGSSTTNNGPAIGGPRRTFAVDVTDPSTGRDGFDAFRRGWDAQVGGAFPLPPFDTGATGEFRVGVHAAKVHDTVIADLHGASIVGRTQGVRDRVDDRVLIHALRRGAWRFAGPHLSSEITVPAGRFIVRKNGLPAQFAVEPHTKATVLILPASAVRPLVGDRPTVGAVVSTEVRVLMAHAGMVAESVNDFTPAGARAARDALIELVKGVLRQELDDKEPRFATALAQAAKDVIDARLDDPHLSPSSLARELNISVRTLHRAFAAAEESVATYIRRRRLEQARLQLAAPLDRPSVSELAARWQFADSSHFIRAFKRQYGQTPARFARSSSHTPESPPTRRKPM
ncbi:helix-turn-helix domain-containing protein [Marinactinospora rubrisoli]|uniref:Helix-turn-helix domain-containing protein n=1 Tax=Marinactinospora rubrisoli TaxID=2715399 RepID=A0ABW2KIC0_9ACTN